MAGQADIILAGGVESMSAVPMGGERFAPNHNTMKTYADAYLGMGLTAENIADEYGITRQMQDEFAVESHKKAAKAQSEGKFDEDIIPITGYKYVENKLGGGDLVPFTFVKDEGIRPESSLEGMAKLKTVFKAGGTVTAGTSSQMSHGAGFVLLMAKENAQELGLVPFAKFVAFTAAGVPARVMGIGPIEAIPKVLKMAKLSKEDIDLFELNEAFASQALACINTLGLDKEKINVNGGCNSFGTSFGEQQAEFLPLSL
jgi:acetyl-CoA acyltransferase